MENFEDTIRTAARENRRVLIQFENVPGELAEREYEPYSIANDTLYAFSYLRDEFRELPLADIRRVEITSRSFVPRRPIEL